jgi:hypothetical protein
MRLRWIVLGASSLVLIGCNGGLPDVYSPSELKMLMEANGYTALGIPDTKMGPAAIVSVTPPSDPDAPVLVSYFGDFRSCGVPDSALNLQTGAAPSVTFKKGIKADASAAASLKGVQIGPEYERVKTTVLNVERAGTEAMDLVKLGVWLSDPVHLRELPEFCKTYLTRKDLYIISEAFLISEGRYDFYDENNVKIAIEAPINPIISVKGAGGLAQTSEGGLAYSTTGEGAPFIGIRNIKATGKGFLGGEEHPYIDDLLQEGFVLSK